MLDFSQTRRAEKTAATGQVIYIRQIIDKTAIVYEEILMNNDKVEFLFAFFAKQQNKRNVISDILKKKNQSWFYLNSIR